MSELNKKQFKMSVIMQKIVKLFALWHIETKKLPKDLRYSIGLKISNIMTDLIEESSHAQFSSEMKHRVYYAERAIAKNDTLKFMLYALFELKGISSELLINLTDHVEEIGKMLYGCKCDAEERLKNKKT